jgi:hypothetical protein
MIIPRMADDYSLPDGRLVCCGCRQPVEPGQCRQIGAAPHGLPACERCFHEAYQDNDDFSDDSLMQTQNQIYERSRTVRPRETSAAPSFGGR